MIMVGIDTMGGSGNSKRTTSWDDWWAEVETQLKSQGGPFFDVQAEYRKLYDDGHTVADAYIIMY